MPMLDTSTAALVLERADRLAACTEEPGRLTRRFATPALAAAGDLGLGWMGDARMTARRDAIGNVGGRGEAPGGAPGGPRGGTRSQAWWAGGSRGAAAAPARLGSARPSTRCAPPAATTG